MYCFCSHRPSPGRICYFGDRWAHWQQMVYSLQQQSVIDSASFCWACTWQYLLLFSFPFKGEYATREFATHTHKSTHVSRVITYFLFSKVPMQSALPLHIAFQLYQIAAVEPKQKSEQPVCFRLWEKQTARAAPWCLEAVRLTATINEISVLREALTVSTIISSFQACSE